MANLKKLLEYLKGVCPLFDYMDSKEQKEFEVELQKEDVSLYTDFIGHTEHDGKVIWKFKCSCCNTIHEREHDVERDFVYLSTTPSEEEDAYKHHVSSTLCKAMILQYRNTFGIEPEGAELRRRYEPGSDAYEVVCYWDSRFPMSYAYAMMLEHNMPEHWSPAAKKFLSEHN